MSSLLFLFATAFAEVKSPTYPYWHVYADANGVSHQRKCEFAAMKLKGVTKGVAPQWLEALDGEVEKVSVTTQPVGWVGDWHENPGPQWIIPLRGRWFVETLDGTRIQMGPGDVSLGEDQNTKPDAKGRRGHLSGTIGDEPATLMIVSLKSKPTVDRPCHQR